jgi:hypothetical protein
MREIMIATKMLGKRSVIVFAKYASEEGIVTCSKVKMRKTTAKIMANISITNKIIVTYTFAIKADRTKIRDKKVNIYAENIIKPLTMIIKFTPNNNIAEYMYSLSSLTKINGMRLINNMIPEKRILIIFASGSGSVNSIIKPSSMLAIPRTTDTPTIRILCTYS